MSDECVAIHLGFRGFSDECALYIEKKVGKRLTWEQVKEMNKCLKI